MKPSRVGTLDKSRTCFVTSRTAEGRALLQSDRMARRFIEVLYHYREEGCFHLHEFVVMPNHFHLLFTVAADLSLERAVQRVKGGFSFRAGKESNVKGNIWQRGFTGHVVRTEDDFHKHAEYIRQNPVKRGLVQSSPDFTYSSAFPGYVLDAMPEFPGTKAHVA